MRRARDVLFRQILPHEAAEEHELYPALAGPLGCVESTVTMSRTHTETARLDRRLDRHLRESPEMIRPDQGDGLRAMPTALPRC